MTSMPASRSARAMTLAPRSWPSRPGLAMTTRILRIYSLHQRHFFVLSPHVPQRIAHLADGRVGPHAVEERLHGIAGADRGVPQRVERAAHGIGVPGLAQRFEPLELDVPRALVDVQNRVWRLVVLHEVVDSDDDLVAALDRLLESVRRLGDLALRKALLDSLDHPAHPVDGVEIALRPLFHVEGEPLDQIRAAQRIGDIGDAALVGDDLLGPE